MKLILDEADEITQEQLDFLTTNKIEPVVKNKNGRLIIVSTPKHKKCFCYTLKGDIACLLCGRGI